MSSGLGKAVGSMVNQIVSIWNYQIFIRIRCLSLSPVYLGAFWMLLTTLSFVALSISVRVLSVDMSVVQIVFLRCFFGILLFLPWIAGEGVGALKTKKFGQHFFRAIFMGVGMILWFAAIGALPLGDAIALHFTLPLFMIIFAAIFLGEKVDAVRWIATSIGFIGVLVVLRPGFQVIEWAHYFVLMSGALYGANHVITKFMSGTETPNATAFYMKLLILPGAAAALPFYWSIPNWDNLGWILILGITGTTAHTCLLKAMRHADASALAPIDFLRLVFSSIAAYFLFGDISDVWTYVGASVIFLAAWYNTWWARHSDQLVKVKRL